MKIAKFPHYALYFERLMSMVISLETDSRMRPLSSTSFFITLVITSETMHVECAPIIQDGAENGGY